MALCCRFRGCEFSPTITYGSSGGCGWDSALGGGVELGVRRCTPSIDCFEASVDGLWSEDCEPTGERPGSGDLDVVCCNSRARFFSELDLTMLFFSASIPRMCGIVGLRGGGVGGMSPVMSTNASIPALSSFRAARGETLKISSTWATRRGEVMSLSGLGRYKSFGSAAGLGGGGGVGIELASLATSIPAEPSACAIASLIQVAFGVAAQSRGRAGRASRVPAR